MTDAKPDDLPPVDMTVALNPVPVSAIKAPAAATDAIPAALAASPPKPAAPRRAPPVPKPIAAAPVAPATVEPRAPVAVPAAAATPQSTPAAAPAPAIIQKDKIMDTVNTAASQTEDKAKAMFNETTDRAKSAMEKGTKLIADINEFSKGNIEAVVESTKIAAKGAEEVARYTTDYAKSAVEKANANARQFASVKSPTEFMRLQSEIAKDAVDSMMAETAKFTENYLKLLGEIAQPISNRVAVAAEKMKLAA